MQTTSRPVSTALSFGLVASVLVTAVPLLDAAFTGVLLEHVRGAYPQWEPHVVAAERNVIAGWLVITQALGIVGWAIALGRLRRGRGVRVVGTVFFALGVVAALLNLTVGFGDYATVVPGGIGVVTLLPVLVGAVALVLLWTRRQGEPGSDAPGSGQPTRR